MKNIIKILTILTLFFSFSNTSSLSHEDIIKMVSAIKKERSGINLTKLDRTPNPFLVVKKRVEEKPKPKEKPKRNKPIVVPEEIYRLVAILNNSAFIDGKWYKVGSRLGSYTISKIGKDMVILKNGKEIRKLTIPKREKKFEMFKGR